MRTLVKIRAAIVAWQLIFLTGKLEVACTSALSTFCPVMGLSGQTVYSTDAPWQTKIGVSKTECAMQCRFSSTLNLNGAGGNYCRCFNYNNVGGNCSLFNVDPVKFAVDPSNDIRMYKMSDQPLSVSWSPIPTASCSFPITTEGHLLYACQVNAEVVSNPYGDPNCPYNYYSKWCFKANRTAAACIESNNSNRCPDGWNGPYNNSCYYVSPNNTLVDQPKARSTCIGYGADLTSVINQEEFDYIISISLALTSLDYWIGLVKTSEATTDATTYWLDMSLSVFRPPWRYDEPNDKSVCTRLNEDTTVLLRDADCSSSFGFVCKMPIDSVNKNTEALYTYHDYMTGYNRSVVSDTVFGGQSAISINSWIVIQIKLPPGNSSVSFSDQMWSGYRGGFGDITTTITNYWIGNDNINKLTVSAQYKLRVEICYSNGSWYSAEYWSFSIGDETSNFQLRVSGFSGDANDALQFPQSATTINYVNVAANGQMFSTTDKDNDAVQIYQCARIRLGGWWYGSTCSMPVLNVDGLALWYDGRSAQPAASNVVASRMKIQLAN